MAGFIPLILRTSDNSTIEFMVYASDTGLHNGCRLIQNISITGPTY